MGWVLFYIFITILVIAGGFTAFRGVSNLLMGGTGLFRKITGIILGCIGIAILAWALLLVDRSESYHARNQLASCTEKLEQIYGDIEAYRRAFKGEVPPSLEAMIERGYLVERDLICPSGHTENGSAKEASDPKYAYTYRCLENPHPDDIILCDSVHHVVPHKLLKFLQKPRRNVLFGNGRVEFIGEEQFQQIMKESHNDK